MKFSRYLMALLAFLATLAVADDSELYVTEVSATTGYRPKILLIFDNSGSMLTTIKSAPPYDAGKKYPATGKTTTNWDESETLKERFYYKLSSETELPDLSGSNYFDGQWLNCSEAKTALLSAGYYTDSIRYFSQAPQDSDSKWMALSGGSIQSPVDCLADIISQNAGNEGKSVAGGQAPAGLPQNGNQASPWYTADLSGYSSSNVMGTKDTITIYTSNYIRLQKNTELYKDLSRLDIAKTAMTDLITSTTRADFGLMLFNPNNEETGIKPYYNYHGGRVVKGIKKTDSVYREELKLIIDNIATGQNLLIGNQFKWVSTWTPLCETLYEAYRYLGGLSVEYGKLDVNNKFPPLRDQTVESNGVYISPYETCINTVNIIYMTDGGPTNDVHANERVKALDTNATFYNGTYLPALAKYMQNNDINGNISKTQRANIYPVGFGSSLSSSVRNMLQRTAENGGGGKARSALNSLELQNAFNEIVAEILDEDVSITSPGVATSAMDRSEILDNLYYTLFSPEEGGRWPGNIKKLKLVNGAVTDVNKADAVGSGGSISGTARTYWTQQASPDGNRVDEGGVTEMLKTKTNRKFYTIKNGAVVEMTLANLESAAGGKSKLSALWGIEDNDTARQRHLDWIKGIDVDDADNDKDTTDKRRDIMADPMHSRVAAINYGGSNATTPDIRLLIGTNGGFLHMFQDLGSSVDESWALMPFEMLEKTGQLRKSTQSSNKIYGIDLTPVIYKSDPNNNGKLDNGEVVWAFVGLRRGGKSYYAFDITTPSSPAFKWMISDSTPGFAELAESWSKPVIGYLKGHGKEPVLFFGGGYDDNKESSGAGTADDSGRAVFAVKADTGELIWKFSAEDKAEKSTKIPFEDGIAGDVAIMDSDYDGYVDRIYAADTGGNIWRLDMPGSSSSDWSGYKFALLGGTSNVDDRRFYVKPAVARSYESLYTTVQTTDETGKIENSVYVKNNKVDYVVIGSGNISRPLNNYEQEKLFILKDYNIVPRLPSIKAPSPLLLSDLFDYKAVNAAALGTSSNADLLALKASYGSTRGCYIALDSGEKAMAPARVAEDYAFFTAFSPGQMAQDTCSPSFGASSLYQARLCDIGSEFTSTVVGKVPLMDAPVIISIKDVTKADDSTPNDDNDEDDKDKPGKDKIIILTPKPETVCEGAGCSSTRVIKAYVASGETED